MSDPDQINVRPNRSRIGGWIRIASIGRNPKVTLLRIAILVVTCVVVFKFILLPIRVEGISMFPTYKDKSLNLVDRIAYVRHAPQRGDVVGIRLGGTNAAYRAPGVMYMKRIVGLPGETVAFGDGRLLINGSVLAEPYLKGECDWDRPPVTLGPDEYFVVGDNRSMPQEYHVFGKVDKERIVGKVLF